MLTIHIFNINSACTFGFRNFNFHAAKFTNHTKKRFPHYLKIFSFNKKIQTKVSDYSILNEIKKCWKRMSYPLSITFLIVLLKDSNVLFVVATPGSELNYFQLVKLPFFHLFSKHDANSERNSIHFAMFFDIS